MLRFCSHFISVLSTLAIGVREAPLDDIVFLIDFRR